MEDSKSTNGAYLRIVGPRNFVPVTWICKSQTGVSHSSSEAEVISLDAALRMEGSPSFMLWELIMEVFQPRTSPSSGHANVNSLLHDAVQNIHNSALYREFRDIDYVPCSIPKSSGRGKLVIFEDNDAVIKAFIKGRSFAMKHVSRTHRVDLDWVWERIREDPRVLIKCVGTNNKLQIFLQKVLVPRNSGFDCVDLVKLGKLTRSVNQNELPSGSANVQQ